MKRVLLPASVSIAVLVCAGVAVWIAFVHSVAETMTAQVRLADELLVAGVPTNEGFARTLLRPGVHVRIADRRARIFVDAGDAGAHVLPAPPDAPFSAEPPPFPPAGAPPPRHGPLGTLALSLARLPPVRTERDERSVEIAPDVDLLARWLSIDTLLVFAGVVAIVVVATNRSAAFARMQRRALEERAAERTAAAERFQRFLAEAGHELRTPLTVMAGYVDILRSRRPGEPLDPRVFEGMHAETSRMRMLVEKMLTLARLDSHAAVPRLLDVATATREATQTLKRRYPDREVDVRAEQSASIIIDADDYAAALGNLLENAVKYAANSAVLVETAVHDGRASTSVTDRGPGIPAGEREAIFEQFYRGRAGGEGLGLGLAIVKRVADRWNGSVECESGDGRTVFRLTFPLADEERDAAR